LSAATERREELAEGTLNKARTGIWGFDEVLNGGFARNRMYLIEGLPGTGKTTLAMQFLLEGVRQGERVLYVTLSETAEELRASAASHGWSLEGVEIFELTPPESLLDGSQQQSLLYSSDLELGETTRTVFTELERVRPDRAVLDSLAELRLLAQDSLRFRRQILALKHYFASHRATVLTLDDMSSGQRDRDVHSLAHGVVRLEELAPIYGAERRRLRIVKYRGTKFRGGYHDFSIVTGGVEVFPRLVAAEHRRDVAREVLGSGTEELDNLLGGGLVYGSSTLVLGPAGSGKTLIALSFAQAAIKRGELASLFLFEEDPGTLASRARGVGMRLDESMKSGRLAVEQVDAAELSPGEFAQRVRNSVEQKGARVVVIDSLNGYQLAMPEDKFLILHMHELLSYLNRRGVLTLLTVAQHGIVGEDMKAPVDVTYLSDTVIMLRFFEATGRVRRAISIVKRRAGPHEQSIRELQITSEGMKLGAPLAEFQGVLQGIPRYTGASGKLLGGEDD
jgi:circadian clock protein KaiC